MKPHLCVAMLTIDRSVIVSLSHCSIVQLCQVDNIRDCERDQILCVSSNKKFLRPKESQQFIEIKANWARACKRRGHQVSDLDRLLFASSSDHDDLENPVSRLSLVLKVIVVGMDGLGMDGWVPSLYLSASN